MLWLLTVCVHTEGLQLISAHLCEPRITLSHVMNAGRAQSLLQRGLIQKQTPANQQTNKHRDSHVRVVCVCTSFMGVTENSQERSKRQTDRYSISTVYISSPTHHPHIPPRHAPQSPSRDPIGNPSLIFPS